MQSKHNVNSYKGKEILVNYDCQLSESTRQRKKDIYNTSDPDDLSVAKIFIKQIRCHLNFSASWGFFLDNLIINRCYFVKVLKIYISDYFPDFH